MGLGGSENFCEMPVDDHVSFVYLYTIYTYIYILYINMYTYICVHDLYQLCIYIIQIVLDISPRRETETRVDNMLP